MKRLILLCFITYCIFTSLMPMDAELQKMRENKIAAFKSINKSVPSLYQLAGAVLRQYGLSDFNSALKMVTLISGLEFPTQPKHFNCLVNKMVQLIIKDDNQICKDTFIPHTLTKAIGQTLIDHLSAVMFSQFKNVEQVYCKCRPMGYGQTAMCTRCKPFGEPYYFKYKLKPVIKIVLPDCLPTNLIKSCITILKEKNRSSSEDYLLQLFLKQKHKAK